MAECKMEKTSAAEALTDDPWSFFVANYTLSSTLSHLCNAIMHKCYVFDCILFVHMSALIARMTRNIK